MPGQKGIIYFAHEPRLTQSQIQLIANACISTAQVFIGTVLLGFFFPGITGAVSFNAFAFNIFITISLLGGGIILIRKVES